MRLQWITLQVASIMPLIKKLMVFLKKNQINIDCISEPQCFSFCLIGTIPVKPEDLLTDRQAQCGGEKGFTTDSYW